MSTANKDERFERIVRQRAKRLGVTVDEALNTAPREPRFIRAAEERGRRLGMSGDEILRLDLERIESSSYPGQNCLQPCDVEDYIDGRPLADISKAHLKECAGCRTLLKVAEPTEESVQRVLEEVRVLLPQTFAAAAGGKGALVGDFTGARRRPKPRDLKFDSSDQESKYSAASNIFDPA